ncbi:MAG: NAD-dependent epimerase/dehydratase [Microgenomates group bacterium GW2011_GWA1_Microgenomates_45_10]|nr:MAG: NAD-dependent epimerase/dehydratase [Microgenomates group bacterium GW2011_GWA2_44_7]KKT87483.1 MAG: NAD-dependent epimerase/dehydratase [Microgenomates group bacterium GW2011_GWA1_Microgenomates_45_10]
MKVLITHANGFMGSHLIDLLITKTNTKIYGLFSPRTPTLKNFKHLKNLSSKVTLREASCLNSRALQQAVKEIKPDIIYHFERFTRPGHAWDKPKDAYDLNVSGTQNLLASLGGNNKIRVIIESSASIYGNVSQADLPLKETSPFYLSEVSGPYEWSVAAQEAVIRKFIFEQKLNIIVGRSFNIEGPRRRTGFATSDFAYQIAMLEFLKDKKSTIKVGNLAARRDWTDVRDAVKAYYLLSHKGKSGEVYNVGSGVIKSINDVLTTLLSYSNITNYQITQDPKLGRPVDIPMLQADDSKLKSTTGWKPTIAFGQMMEDILEDWRERVKIAEYD